MTNGNLETEIKNFVHLYNDDKHVSQAIRANKRYVEYLNSRYPMLSNKRYSIGMKLFWLMNGIEDFPRCAECGKPNTTNRCNISTGYASNVCSVACSNGKGKFDKIRKTCLEKYGVENCHKDPSVVAKTKRTNLERYGVDNPSKSKEISDKIFETKKLKYGDGNFTNIEKAKSTNIERYGCENVFSNSDVKEKIKATLVEKYGVDNPMKCQNIKDVVIEKMTEKSIHKSYENYLMSNPYAYPNFSEEYYLSHRRKRDGYEFVCRTCGKTFISRIHNGNIRRCPECYPTVTTSIKEKELFDFISNTYDGVIERKNRTEIAPKELDIFIPKFRLGIEFDGLYWHSELNEIGSGYHLDKTNECESRGIHLIHIFEDEWDSKREIVKSRIANMLGAYKKIVYARKCSVMEIDSKVANEFIDKNHIQGAANSSVNIGLYNEGELISVMTFCKPRIALGNKSTKTGEWELLRFCNLLGYHVVGGAGKLLKFFERKYNPTRLTSYADRRWSHGNLYIKLNFKEIRKSKPNYWYIDNGCNKRFHRFSFRKSVLKNKLETFDENLSEVQNMKNNKFTRIFDCGNLVFEKIYEQ